mgnify:CR=1 FL=1
MDNQRLEELLRERLPNLEGCPGMWRAEVGGLLVVIVSDEAHDRMRVMSPAAPAPDDPDRLRSLLEANYDRALDAKYAIHEGVLWATFMHRLSWLGSQEIDNALAQVLTLARNTGTSDSSGGLVFGAGE